MCACACTRVSLGPYVEVTGELVGISFTFPSQNQNFLPFSKYLRLLCLIYLEGINNNDLEAQWQMKLKNCPKSGISGSLSGIALLCLFHFGESHRFPSSQNSENTLWWVTWVFFSLFYTTHTGHLFNITVSHPIQHSILLLPCFIVPKHLWPERQITTTKSVFFPSDRYICQSYSWDDLWIDNSFWHMVDVQ